MSSRGIEITFATPDELDWCARLVGRSDPWKQFGISSEKFRLLFDRPATEVFIARRSSEKLGFIRVTQFTFSGQPLVNTLVVEENARNQGVGSELLRFTFERYADRRFIFLQVSDFNHDAQRLYLRHGFVKVGEVPDCIAEGNAEFIFAKRLK